MDLPSYSNSVFINCPFDQDYEPLLDSIIFTVYACGFIPRSALEEDDSSDMRLDKIVRLIHSSFSLEVVRVFSHHKLLKSKLQNLFLHSQLKKMAWQLKLQMSKNLRRFTKTKISKNFCQK